MDNSWVVKQSAFTEADIGKYESLFSLGNGNLGLRGNLEERESTYRKGTYINGFYETEPIQYGEWAYGYPEENQKIIPLPEGKLFEFYAEGKQFSTADGTDHSRILNMKEGHMIRTFKWKVRNGLVITVSITRMVSFAVPSMAVQILRFKFDGNINSLRVVSSLETQKHDQKPLHKDPRAGSLSGADSLKKIKSFRDGLMDVCGYKTKRSNLVLAAGMDHLLLSGEYTAAEYRQKEGGSSFVFDFTDPEEDIVLVKFLSYHQGDNSDTAIALCRDDLASAGEQGVDYLKMEQIRYLRKFWEKSDVKLPRNEELQKVLRLNLFHLVQSSGKNGKTSVAAKGLSGDGYDGHYFWDSEIYVVPFFQFTSPEIARSLLLYRYSILDKARERAQELSHKGALFPWRTINGREASAYFPAGTAQYHINADIAYSINRYLESTDDLDFLVTAGFEILVETARFWYDLGNFIPSKNGAFCIHEVTGPDEYSALVNNNFYTNIMAKDNFTVAVKWYDWLKKNDYSSFMDITKSLKIQKDERAHWETAAQKMYLPFNEEYGIFPQDDSFLDRPVWDIKNTPSDKFPLLLHFHPLAIYRFQVLKQADVVMALFLQWDKITFEKKKRSFDYYEKITTGDSSLSAAIQGVIALELGYVQKGYEYFLKTLTMDYDDVNGNVKDGIHTASMGGSWILVVYGFAGMRVGDNLLHFSPHLPLEIEQISFRIQYKKMQLEITLEQDSITFLLLSGKSLNLSVNKSIIELFRGEKSVMAISK